MTTLNVDLPNEVFEDITDIAKDLQQSPSDFVQMALSLLMQSDSLANAMVAMDRVRDNQQPVALPDSVPSVEPEDEEGEGLDLQLEIHPDALAELQVLDEDQQIDILSDLYDRILSETQEEADDLFSEGIDLVINETETSQTILSSFEYGEVVYTLGDKLVIYLINCPDVMDEDYLEEDEEEENVRLDA